MYAPMSRAWSSVNIGFLASAWASCRDIGIRPVPTWNSTAADPTPIRLGPLPGTPWPRPPWQAAQLWSKMPLPRSAAADRPEVSSAIALGANPV
jgi:hypothetical protein